MNLKERAREEALKYSTRVIDESRIVNMTTTSSFYDGAEWGFRQALEELRKKPYEGSWTEVKEAGQMADWLLDKAGME